VCVCWPYNNFHFAGERVMGNGKCEMGNGKRAVGLSGLKLALGCPKVSSQQLSQEDRIVDNCQLPFLANICTDNESATHTHVDYIVGRLDNVLNSVCCPASGLRFC